jgi:hypothetical protein
MVILPMLEEAFFRLAVLTTVAQDFGVVWGIVVQAIWFAANHKDGRTLRVLRALVYGAVFAKGGGVVASLLCHIATNITALFFGDSLPSAGRPQDLSSSRGSQFFRCHFCSSVIALGQYRYNCASCPRDNVDSCEACFSCGRAASLHFTG